MKPAIVVAVIFLAFAAVGTTDYQLAFRVAAERAPAVLAAQAATP